MKVYVYIFMPFSIVSVAVCTSSFDTDNFLALRLVLMILIGVSFAADGVIVCKPTCLLLIVCITCCVQGKEECI